MKKILLLFLLASCLLSCTDKEDETVDITVMPEATSEGADTFGCLVDGWVYVGGRYSPYIWGEGNTPSINFQYSEKQDNMKVSVRVKYGVSMGFTIPSPKSGQESDYVDAFFDEEEMEDGKVFITRFDTKKKIISGTFEGGSITKGRFDVHYTIYKGYEEPTQDQ